MSKYPWYVIMDERAHTDIDKALILAADGDRPSLEVVRGVRDRDWPVCPIVEICTRVIVDPGHEGEGDD